MLNDGRSVPLTKDDNLELSARQGIVPLDHGQRQALPDAPAIAARRRTADQFFTKTDHFRAACVSVDDIMNFEGHESIGRAFLVPGKQGITAAECVLFLADESIKAAFER